MYGEVDKDGMGWDGWMDGWIRAGHMRVWLAAGDNGRLAGLALWNEGGEAVSTRMAPQTGKVEGEDDEDDEEDEEVKGIKSRVK